MWERQLRLKRGWKNSLYCKYLMNYQWSKTKNRISLHLEVCISLECTLYPRKSKYLVSFHIGGWSFICWDDRGVRGCINHHKYVFCICTWVGRGWVFCIVHYISSRKSMFGWQGFVDKLSGTHGAVSSLPPYSFVYLVTSFPSLQCLPFLWDHSFKRQWQCFCINANIH